MEPVPWGADARNGTPCALRRARGPAPPFLPWPQGEPGPRYVAGEDGADAALPCCESVIGSLPEHGFPFRDAGPLAAGASTSFPGDRPNRVGSADSSGAP